MRTTAKKICHMKDPLNNGKTWFQCFVPTLYAISVLRHLDLKTHFDNHCIFSESVFVLLEKKEKKKMDLQGELDCLSWPFVNIRTVRTDRDKLTSAYFVSNVGDDTNHKSSVSCNQLINRCKWQNLSHCAPLAKYTFFTVCLSLDCMCRNDCHSFFLGTFFYPSFFTLFGLFIHRMRLWRKIFLVLLVLIGKQTVPYLPQLLCYKFLD